MIASRGHSKDMTGNQFKANHYSGVLQHMEINHSQRSGKKRQI
jgi:hypothetical protein